MHTDGAFYIGKTHDICEDYVLYNNDDAQHPRVVLCDGCSSSDMVDVGARLLALDFINRFTKAFGRIGVKEIEFFAHTFFHDNYFNLIQQHSTMCDATLLFLRKVRDEKIIECGVIGDGVVVVKSKEGYITIRDFDSENMPRYLSYSWNEERRNLYGERPHKVNVYSETITATYSNLSYYNRYGFNSDECEWIAVMSDGVHSFKDATGKSINFMDIIKELTDFKTFSGRFTQRRMNAFRKKCVQNGWTHDDDISIGCIYLGE